MEFKGELECGLAYYDQKDQEHDYCVVQKTNQCKATYAEHPENAQFENATPPRPSFDTVPIANGACERARRSFMSSMTTEKWLSIVAYHRGSAASPGPSS